MRNLITNRNIVIGVILVAVFTAGATFFLKREDNLKPVLGEAIEQERIKIAVCPTYYDLLDSVPADIGVIKAGSTSESLSYLSAGEADYVLAGRILKPGEKEFPFQFLGRGYSFLSPQPKTITEKELSNLTVFTDLDIQEINQVFDINNLISVDNIYDFLDQGIGITSWDNTDYSKAEIVHLYRPDGSRSPDSRIPILYCLNSCDNQMANLLKEGLDN